MGTASKPLDDYIRVSRVGGREGESFISPDVQRSAIDRWAGDREIRRNEPELDRSGGTMSRPVFDSIMARVRAGQSGGIVVYKLDRFARSLIGALDVIEELETHGAVLVSTSEQIDLSTSTGRAFVKILLVFAELERERIRESWAIAQERAVARGVHIASATPTGYQRDESKRLIPDPVDGPAVTELAERRLRGESWRDLGRFLTERGVTGPYGTPHWTPKALATILSNRVYLGEARSGKFVNPDAHEPLIDHATFTAIAHIKGDAVPRSEEGTLLAGLLRCAGCRHLLKPDAVTNSKGQRLRMYRCRGEHASGKCRDRTAVLESVIAPVIERQFFADVGGSTATGAALHEELHELEHDVAAADAELVAYRDDERIAGILGADRYVDGLQKRVEDLEAAELALVRARVRLGILDVFDTDVVSEWSKRTVGQRRKALSAVFDAIMVRSGKTRPITERTHFIHAGELPDDFPRRGRRVELKPFTWPDGHIED